MVCSNCLLPGHNSRSKICITNVIYTNFDLIYKYTHSYPYYMLSLKYFSSMCETCCLYYNQLIWKDKVLQGAEDLITFIQHNICTKKYIIVDLSINKNHSNYIFVNIKDKTITYYEPHGYPSYDRVLDKVLESLSRKVGYFFIPSIIDCPGLGNQIITNDSRGLCQTFSLYNLYNRLSTTKEPKNKEKLTKEVKMFASKCLTFIYYRYLSENMKIDFLTFNIQTKQRQDEIVLHTGSYIWKY